MTDRPAPSTAIGVVDPSNAAQAAAWGGPEGRYWADHPTRFDRSLAAYHDPFMQASQITRESNVLDIGCGTGETTRAAARLALDGAAVGIDLSGDMVAVARTLAATDGLHNATFVHGDAQVHPLPPRHFDRVISRTGLMFFAEPTKAFANIANAMPHGGRLTALTWQPADRNAWIGAFAGALLGHVPTPTPDVPGPFSMSDPDTVRGLLGTAGFTDVDLEDLQEPMVYGDDVDDAHRFVLGLLGWMLDGKDPDERHRAQHALRTTLEAHRTRHGVAFDSAAWLITAHRA